MKIKPKGNKLDTFDSEDSLLLKLAGLLQMVQLRTCDNDECPQNGEQLVNPTSGLVVRRPDLLPLMCSSRIEDPCEGCNNAKCIISYQWPTTGPPPSSGTYGRRRSPRA
ncbi:hypothetical protein Fcan01_05259 [Folsomia candida]|uniref:Uncharacterized protein n=1 Tax=Folsomia candida TaxID=158441 RepID=A0A226EVB9_FOLCA|nr:hypothetical protein Fcan01_05259 [Folsomia candida]